jgi:electron transfer flavoprotein beta subunit
MKVLVPVKRVVDFNVKIRVRADGSGIDLGNLKMSMNPFDENRRHGGDPPQRASSTG